MPRFKVLKTNKYLSIISICVILFVLTAIAADKHSVSHLEKSIFDFVYNWGIDAKPVFWTITQLGSVWVALSGIVIFWFYKKRELALKLLIGGALTYSLVQIAKVLVDRPRPALLLTGVAQRESMVSGNGFPSGHTAMITFFCVIIQPYLPKKLRWLVWPVIAAVAISRMYLGVHLPLDVVGGFAIGSASGFTVRYLQPKLNRQL